MTTREYLNGIRKEGNRYAIPGFCLFFGGGLLSAYHWSLKILGIVGFILFIGGVYHIFFTGWCLFCRKNLSRFLYRSSGLTRINDSVKFCVHCGKSLDEPYAPPPKRL